MCKTTQIPMDKSIYKKCLKIPKRLLTDSKKLQLFIGAYIAWCFAIYLSRIYIDMYCEYSILSLLSGTELHRYDCGIATTFHSIAVRKYYMFWSKLLNLTIVDEKGSLMSGFFATFGL